MKNIFLLLTFFLIIIFVVVFHISLSYLLAHPFSKINTIFIFLISFIIWKESGWVVWVSFVAHFFVELFSLMPFGVLLFSGTLSILITYWLHTEVFTNHSWYANSLLCLSSLVIFRILYVVILAFFNIFINIEIAWSDLLFTFLIEILFTAATFTIFYVCFYWLFRKFLVRIT